MHCQWRPFNICVWDVLRLSSFFSWKVPVAMFGYFTLAAIVLKTAAPDYKELWRELSRLEGRFAFVHARTKSCAVRHLACLVCCCWGPAVVHRLPRYSVPPHACCCCPALTRMVVMDA